MAAKVAYAVTTNTPQIKQNTNYGNDVIINSVMTIKNPTKKTFDNCKIINIDYENHTVDAECGKMKALKSTNDKSPSEERLAKYIPSPATTSEEKQEPGVMNKIKALFHLCTF